MSTENGKAKRKKNTCAAKPMRNVALQHRSFQMNASARGLHKKYKAIVVGEMPADSGTIDLPLGRPDPEEVERCPPSAS